MKLMTRMDVCDGLRVSKTSLYVMLKQGRLPKPALYFGKSPRWAKNEVEAWIAGEIKQQKEKA